jgi:FkbH-like protein
LRSLQIQVTVSEADDVTIPRIAQMTQKTNQFNLTTRRYQDSDIRQFLQDGWRIWSISVSDRFGDSGITGCALVHGNDVDSFLLSCRVLGKGIESIFLKTVLSILKKEGCQAVTAHYVPTLKNAQVADFYEKCGFSCVGKSEDGKDYVLELAQADLAVADYYQITIK